jgi:hypothetical protein
MKSPSQKLPVGATQPTLRATSQVKIDCHQYVQSSLPCGARRPATCGLFGTRARRPVADTIPPCRLRSGTMRRRTSLTRAPASRPPPTSLWTWWWRTGRCRRIGRPSGRHTWRRYSRGVTGRRRTSSSRPRPACRPTRKWAGRPCVARGSRRGDHGTPTSALAAVGPTEVFS